MLLKKVWAGEIFPNKKEVVSFSYSLNISLREALHCCFVFMPNPSLGAPKKFITPFVCSICNVQILPIKGREKCLVHPAEYFPKTFPENAASPAYPKSFV